MDTIQQNVDTNLDFFYLERKFGKGTAKSAARSSSLGIIESRIKAIDVVKEYQTEDMGNSMDSSTHEEFSLDLPRNVLTKDVLDPVITDNDVIRWRGYVTDINDTHFTTQLHDLDLKGTYEVGEFEKTMIPSEDLPLLEIGAVFYLSLGFFSNSKGVKKKETIMKFQRLITWTEDDYNAAIDRADSLFDEIRFE